MGAVKKSGQLPQCSVQVKLSAPADNGGRYQSDSDDDSGHSNKTYTKEKNILEPCTKPILKPTRPRSCSLRSSIRSSIVDPKDVQDKKKAYWHRSTSPSLSSNSSVDRKSIKRDVKVEEKKDKKANIACFKRSLKLLGFHPEDFDVKLIDNKQTEITTPRTVPTFSTRLKKRSVSLSSLLSAGTSPAEAVGTVVTPLRTFVDQPKSAQDDGVFPFDFTVLGWANTENGPPPSIMVRTHNSQMEDQLERETLSKAVYEEWYFRKVAEERIHREIREEKERMKMEMMEKAKQEQKRKSEEQYNHWKQLKSQLMKRQSKTLTRPRSCQDLPDYSANQAKAEEAFRMWKAEKDKLLQKKSKLRKERENTKTEKHELEEKKSSAASAYQAWKEQADELLKQKAEEEEKLRKKVEERKKKEKEERQEHARLSYQLWKEMKENEIKQKLKEQRLAAAEADRQKKNKQTEKVCIAQQAFEQWLDLVEEREKMRRSAQKQGTNVNPPPPWNPGGRVSR